MTVKALREMLARSDSAQFIINFPYGKERADGADRVELGHYTYEDDPALTFRLTKNGVTIKRSTIRVSEIFGLAEDVRAIVAKARMGEQ